MGCACLFFNPVFIKKHVEKNITYILKKLFKWSEAVIDFHGKRQKSNLKKEKIFEENIYSKIDQLLC